jgi:hypothetical protein
MKTEKKSIGWMLLSVCPYTHLWEVIKTSVKKRKLTATMRSGLLIFLLGLCCPIFWVKIWLVSGSFVICTNWGMDNGKLEVVQSEVNQRKNSMDGLFRNLHYFCTQKSMRNERQNRTMQLVR